MAMHPARRASRRETTRAIAIVRALNLGDLICATPAIRGLRAAFPRARLTLVGLPWAEEFVRRSAELDDFMEFPGWEGIPEREPDEARLTAFVVDAAARNFDLAIQLHGDGRVMNGFLDLIGAGCNAGFVPASETPPSERFIPYPDQLPEPLRLLRVARRLGAPDTGTHLDFPLDASDRGEASALLAQHDLTPGSYIAVHPGGRRADRRWPVGRFAEVMRTLSGSGYRFVITGSDSERPIAAELAEAAGVGAVDLAGHTTLGSLGAVIEGARLLIANDTGVSHVAAATGTRSVIVFTGSDPSRWAPLSPSHHRAVHAQGADERRASNGTAVAVQGRLPEVEAVVEQAWEQLEAARGIAL